MKSIPLYVLAFLLFPFLAAAQSNYKPGYVITPKGDTVKGFIDYRNWDASPTSVSFKTNLADHDKQSYTMANASGFGVYGLATYQKFLVSISMDVTNTLHLVEGRDTSFRIDTVFLRVLQEGKNLALYQYTDNFKTRFYISKAPSFIPAELVFRLYYDMNEKGNGQTVNENTYQKQLFALASELKVQDSELKNLIESADYDKSDLLKIVSGLNGISSAEFEKRYSERLKIRPYLSGGATLTVISALAGSAYAASGGTGSNSVLPFFAAGVDLEPSPYGRLAFKIDISVNPAHLNSLYKLTVDPYTEQQTTYNQLAFIVGPQVLYRIYNRQNLKFYLGAGYVLTYNRFSNSYFGAPNNGHSQITDFPFFFNPTADGYLFKAGAGIGRNVEVFYTYYGVASTTRDNYFLLTSQANQLGLSYIFGK